MEIIGLDRGQLDQVFESVNQSIGGNLLYNRSPEFMRNTRGGKPVFRLTLRVIDSSGPGARRSHRGRRLVSACWHTHGQYIDAVLDAGGMVRVSRRHGKELIESSSDNWQDWNIGSMVYPMYYSEACDCDDWRGPSDDQITLWYADVAKYSESKLQGKLWGVPQVDQDRLLQSIALWA